jgi:hypothetical protein
MVQQKSEMWVPLYESEIGLLMEILNSDKDYLMFSRGARIDQIKAIFHARIQAKRQQAHMAATGGMMPQRGQMRPQVAPDEGQDGLFGGGDDLQDENVDLTQEGDEFDPGMEEQPDFPQPIPPGKPGANQQRQSMMPNQGKNMNQNPHLGRDTRNQRNQSQQGGIAQNKGAVPSPRQPTPKQQNPDEDFGSFSEESF